MTLEFFVNNYDIKDFDIKKIYIDDNKLYIKAIYNVYLELIANGYRPEMNVDYEKTFIFNTNYNNHKFKSNNLEIISFLNNILKIKIDDIILELFSDVKVI